MRKREMKVGVKVKITDKPKKKGQWPYWNTNMYEYMGKQAVIKSVEHSSACELNTNNFIWRNDWLIKV